MTDTLDAIRRHSGTALGIARGYARKLPRNILREDIEQAALIGLWRWKVDHPDEETPGWFGGLRQRIRGSIIDELRRQAPFSRYAHRDQALFVDGLDDVFPGWANQLAAESVDPCERIDAQRIVSEAMGARLSPREATVIDLVYYRHLKQRGVATTLAVTEARVSQIRSRALAKMRAKLEGRPGLAKCGPKKEGQ